MNAETSFRPPAKANAVRIVEAARILFIRHGYRRTSMDDIAGEAGLAKATLYLHFSGKPAVFKAMLDQCRERVNERIAETEQSGAPFAERLAGLLYAYGGTALEWFGDARHIAELRAVADDIPDIAVRQTRDEEIDRVMALIATTTAAGEISTNRLGATVKAIAGALVDAAAGAKQGDNVSLDLYRQRLTAIAALANAALSKS